MSSPIGGSPCRHPTRVVSVIKKSCGFLKEAFFGEDELLQDVRPDSRREEKECEENKHSPNDKGRGKWNSKEINTKQLC